jgi:hypothetical protein
VIGYGSGVGGGGVGGGASAAAPSRTTSSRSQGAYDDYGYIKVDYGSIAGGPGCWEHGAGGYWVCLAWHLSH